MLGWHIFVRRLPVNDESHRSASEGASSLFEKDVKAEYAVEPEKRIVSI